jgi:hypothetical protein
VVMSSPYFPWMRSVAIQRIAGAPILLLLIMSDPRSV